MQTTEIKKKCKSEFDQFAEIAKYTSSVRNRFIGWKVSCWLVWYLRQVARYILDSLGILKGGHALTFPGGMCVRLDPGRHLVKQSLQLASRASNRARRDVLPGVDQIFRPPDQHRPRQPAQVGRLHSVGPRATLLGWHRSTHYEVKLRQAAGGRGSGRGGEEGPPVQALRRGPVPTGGQTPVRSLRQLHGSQVCVRDQDNPCPFWVLLCPTTCKHIAVKVEHKEPMTKKYL